MSALTSKYRSNGANYSISPLRRCRLITWCAVNQELTLVYWNIGRRIHNEVLRLTIDEPLRREYIIRRESQHEDEP